MAADTSLSRYEKIGFPDSYRAGHEAAIFADIRKKLPILDGERRRVLDVGPGCSDLPRLLSAHCAAKNHELTFVDSAEMLAQLPDAGHIRKIAGRFPDECMDFVEQSSGTFDAVIAYSVLHYVLPGADIFGFFDRLCRMLAPGAALLIGDIPNVSKRKRFFASPTGIEFHKRFMDTSEPPAISFNVPEVDSIDDAVIVGLILRGRAAGFDVYVLPQPSSLPMANRREDLLVCRP